MIDDVNPVEKFLKTFLARHIAMDAFHIQTVEDCSVMIDQGFHRAALLKGLQLMAKDYPQQWADFMDDNDDANTGDVFVQLCCFGKTIYG